MENKHMNAATNPAASSEAPIFPANISTGEAYSESPTFSPPTPMPSPLQSDFQAPFPAQRETTPPTDAPPSRPPIAPRRYRNPNSTWITMLTVFSWIFFVLLIIAGAASGVMYAYAQYSELSSSGGILSIAMFSLAGILLAVLLISFMKVWLNLASDVRAIRFALENQKKH